MNPEKFILISYQEQCDGNEIETLINHLKQLGFEIKYGHFTHSEFDKVILEAESYVCVLNKASYQSQDLAREIFAAAQHGKKVFAIYCPKSELEIQIPPALDTCAAGITDWNLEKIVAALDGKDIGFVDQNGGQKPMSRTTKPPHC